MDLNAAYDTMNHNQCIQIYEIVNYYKTTHLINGLLKDRRFYVSFNEKNNCKILQKNGLPQGSRAECWRQFCLTFTQTINLFGAETQNILYADDLVITAQRDTHFKLME